MKKTNYVFYLIIAERRSVTEELYLESPSSPTIVKAVIRTFKLRKQIRESNPVIIELLIIERIIIYINIQSEEHFENQI